MVLQVSKSEVMRRVADATAYTAGKMTGDVDAFDRIPTVDEDCTVLDRFWDECRSELLLELKGLVDGESFDGNAYSLSLNLSRSFDPALVPSMQINLMEFFVQGVTAKWFVFSNKEEAGAYSDKAQSLLDDLHRKALFKRKPLRPKFF